MNSPNAYFHDLQRPSKSQGTRIKRKRPSPTSLLNTTYWRLWSSLIQRYKQDLHYSIIETNNKEYCPGTMNIYFIWDRQDQKRLSGISWHGLVLHKILNIDCLCSTCQVCQTTKKERKKYGLLQSEIAESDALSLGYGMCGSGRSIHNKDTSQKTLWFYTCNHKDRSSHWLVWNCQSHK
jgi:hypothetical protein